MGCLYYPRKQTSVSYAAGCTVITCYGSATVYAKHLASTVHCVDDEIIEWLRRRGVMANYAKGLPVKKSAT
jgi:hypothetical protein